MGLGSKWTLYIKSLNVFKVKLKELTFEKCPFNICQEYVTASGEWIDSSHIVTYTI